MNTKIVKLSKFSFINKSGGTGMSDWEFNEQFEGPCSVKIITSWHDEEIGVRLIGESADENLNQYLNRVACADKRIFFSKFDILS